MGRLTTLIRREVGRRHPLADETETGYIGTVEIVALTKRTFGTAEIERKITQDFTPCANQDALETAFGVEMACRELIADALRHR
jgi:hypothetical protein